VRVSAIYNLKELQEIGMILYDENLRDDITGYRRIYFYHVKENVQLLQDRGKPDGLFRLKYRFRYLMVFITDKLLWLVIIFTYS